MSAVSTSIDPSTGGLQLSWVAPSNGHETITSYSVEIANSAGAYSTHTNCLSSISAVMLNLKCIVPMSDLTSTYGLSFETLVLVRAKASNAYGDGDYSPINTAGGKIRRIPNVMPAPTITSYSDTSF